MAKKILNLKLIYKGKHLDTIRQGTDFAKKWYIGSDKHIFWQILDDTGTFPQKHQLLAKRGNELYLNLPEGSSISCSKDESPVDAAFLQQNNILQGASLKLRNDMTGNVKLNQDYSVQYFYTEPVVSHLTLREKAILADCSSAPPLLSSERTNRGVILLFLILGIAFILIYDLVLKPRDEVERSFSEMLAEMDRAQRIVPQIGEPPQGAVFETPIEEDVPQSEAAASGEATQTREDTRSPGSTRAVFGDLTTPRDQANSQTAYQATVLDEFVTARPGSRGGGGTGTGTSVSGPGGFTPSAGAGYAGTFDPSATAGYTETQLGRVVTGKTPAGGTTVRPNAAIETFTGDASRLQRLAPENVPLPQSPQIESIKRSFQAQEVPSLSEASIAGSPAARVTDVDNIYEQLNHRKGQIKQSYIRNSAIKAASGSITVIMYINEDGSVVADIIPNSATFTQSFLEEVKTIVENWRFNVSKKTKYRFQMRLSQS